MRIDHQEYRQHLEDWVTEQQNDDMRERFAEIVGSSREHYYSRDFARHACDNEMSLNEYVANVAWEIADAMLLAKR